MKQKYNLALLPASQAVAQGFIDFAALHTALADGYLLGNNSLPHVTIHQFLAHDVVVPDLIDLIEASNLTKTLELQLSEFSCLSFDGHSYWTSLLPNQRDTLTTLHQEYAQLLHLPIKPNYDPHLTLFRTLDPNYQDRVNQTKKLYTPLNDTFKLTLGKSDPLGQFIEIVARF